MGRATSRAPLITVSFWPATARAITWSLLRDQRVDEAGVGNPVVLLEADRGALLGVPRVDPDELDALVLRLLGHPREVLGLQAAGPAPRAPHVQHDDLALVVGDVELLAVEGLAV